jgi:hypothetical protein
LQLLNPVLSTSYGETNYGTSRVELNGMANAATVTRTAASRAALRHEAALNRLQRLARGRGLTIVSYEAGRFAIVGKLERIETIIERCSAVPNERQRFRRSYQLAPSER